MNCKLRLPGLITGVICTLASAPPVFAQNTVKLAWDANTEPEVTGYRLHYGTTSGDYSSHIDVGNVTTYTVSGLDGSLNYYFAVQAYTGDGVVSDLSNEVALPALAPPGTTVISELVANTAYPLLVGRPVTWTATAKSTRGAVEYRFMKFNSQSGWTVLQDYSQSNSATWTPGWNDRGTTLIQLWARTVGSPAAYEAWVNTDTFEVNAGPVQLTADVDFPTPPGNPVHWTATIAGASNEPLEYRFVLFTQATNVWSELRAYGSSNQVTWTPTQAGGYAIQVWARRVGSTVPYDVWTGTSVTVSQTPLEVSSLSVNVPLPTTTGKTMTWTARVKGGMVGPIQYQFVRFSSVRGWEIVQRYSGSNTYVWTPGFGEDAQYSVQIWVRNAGSTALYDAWGGGPLFDVQKAPLLVTVKNAFPVPPGTTANIVGQVADTTASFEYQCVLYNRGTGTWSMLQPYSTSNTCTWMPSAVGTYLIQVWARRVGSTAVYEVWAPTDYLNVSVGPAQMVSLTPSISLPARSGTAITWTAVANGGTAAPLEYRFVMLTVNVWTELRAYGAQNTFTWTPTSADIGTHLIQVWVRSAGSTAVYESWTTSGFFTIQP